MNEECQFDSYQQSLDHWNCCPLLSQYKQTPYIVCMDVWMDGLACLGGHLENCYSILVIASALKLSDAPTYFEPTITHLTDESMLLIY